MEFVPTQLAANPATGVLLATLVAPRDQDTSASQNDLYPHPENSLNPHFANGSAASRFWTSCWDTLIDHVVLGEYHYDTSEPRDLQEIRDLVAHPVVMVSKPILRYAYGQRDRINVFIESMSWGFDIPDWGAQDLFNVDFTFDVDLADGYDKSYGMQWSLEDDIATTFSRLRTTIITINFSNKVGAYVGAYVGSGRMPVSRRFKRVRSFLRGVIEELREDLSHVRHKYIAVQDPLTDGMVDSGLCKTASNITSITQRILRKRGRYVEF